jgi:hypothetical protein
MWIPSLIQCKDGGHVAELRLGRSVILWLTTTLPSSDRGLAGIPGWRWRMT